MVLNQAKILESFFFNLSKALKISLRSKNIAVVYEK